MFKFFKEKLQNLFGKKQEKEIEIHEEKKAKVIEEAEKTKKISEKNIKKIEEKQKFEGAIEDLEEKLEKKQIRKSKLEEKQKEKYEEFIEEVKEKIEPETKEYIEKPDEKKTEEVKEKIEVKEVKEKVGFVIPGITKPHKEEEKEIKMVKPKISEIGKEPKKIIEKEIPKTEVSKIDTKTKIPEIPKIEKEPEKLGFFAKIQSKFNTVKLDQETFDDFFEKLELLLIENNVALKVVDKIRQDMEKRLLNIEIKKDRLEAEIKETLKESILEILLDPFNLIEKIKSKQDTFVILFFGINGSGKTTTIAKIASLLKENNITSVLAAADTFRAASIEQLKKHGEHLGVKVIHQTYGSDPSAVAFDAISYAKAHQIKVVLIDTAGRMHTKDNLLKEMEKIVRVTKPDLKIFVAESITGNDATEQAKAFNEIANIDGTILTKADVDEKGGTAISIGYVTGKPILYLGTGQTYKDLSKFDPREIIVNLGLD